MRRKGHVGHDLGAPRQGETGARSAPYFSLIRDGFAVGAYSYTPLQHSVTHARAATVCPA